MTRILVRAVAVPLVLAGGVVLLAVIAAGLILSWWLEP